MLIPVLEVELNVRVSNVFDAILTNCLTVPLTESALRVYLSDLVEAKAGRTPGTCKCGHDWKEHSLVTGTCNAEVEQEVFPGPSCSCTEYWDALA